MELEEKHKKPFTTLSPCTPCFWTGHKSQPWSSLLAEHPLHPVTLRESVCSSTANDKDSSSLLRVHPPKTEQKCKLSVPKKSYLFKHRWFQNILERGQFCLTFPAQCLFMSVFTLPSHSWKPSFKSMFQYWKSMSTDAFLWRFAVYCMLTRNSYATYEGDTVST